MFNTHIHTKIVHRISDTIERRLEVRSGDDADMFFLISDNVDNTLILLIAVNIDFERVDRILDKIQRKLKDIHPANFELHDDIDDLPSIYLKETMPCG